MSKFSVLVIEHDWRMRKMLRANLEALGLEVLEAVSARHAFEMVEGRRPDLIMVDSQLPDVDAIRLMSDIRARWAGRGR